MHLEIEQLFLLLIFKFEKKIISLQLELRFTHHLMC